MATMAERGSVARNKLTSGLLVGTVASGMVAASLITTAPANAWCVGFSGININFGGSCNSGIGSIALGLGPNAVANSDALTFAVTLGDGTSNSRGFLTGAIAVGGGKATSGGILTAAWAGGVGTLAQTDGIIAWAVAQSATGIGPLEALAGAGRGDIANFAFNFGDANGPLSSVRAGLGVLNLAANIGGLANSGKPLDVFAGNGVGNSAINLIANRSQIAAGNGFFNGAINVGTPIVTPNGSDSTVNAGNGSLNFAFNVQPPFITPPDSACPGDVCGNDVFAGNGSFGLAGSIAQVQTPVIQEGPGFNINGFKVPMAATATLAASAPQESLAATAGSDPGGSAAKEAAKEAELKSVSDGINDANTNPARPGLTSVSDRITKSTNRSSNAITKLTNKRAGKAKADTSGSSTE